MLKLKEMPQNCSTAIKSRTDVKYYEFLTGPLTRLS